MGVACRRRLGVVIPPLVPAHRLLGVHGWHALLRKSFEPDVPASVLALLVAVPLSLGNALASGALVGRA